MDFKGLVITVIGAVVGVIISMFKKGYKQIGQGIAFGSLLVGLPLTFLGVSGMGSLSTETTSTLSQMSTDIEKSVKEGVEKFKGYSSGFIDTE